MAYKFQNELAIMSGALDQEGNITVFDQAGAAAVALGDDGEISGSSDLKIGGTVQFDGVATAAVTATDGIFFKDSDGLMKVDAAGDLRDLYFSAVSGDATIAAGGALTIAADAVESGMLNDNVISGQTELAQGSLDAADEFLISDGGTIKRYGVDSLAKDSLALTTEAAADVSADYIVFLDGGATGETKKESYADLVASSAGLGLASAAGQYSLDFSELTDEVIASGDRIAFRDAGDDGMHADTVDDLAALFAGAGLAASSAVIGVANATNGGLAINANDMQVDLNDLSAASVSVANDSIAIIDSDDSNASRKESIADLVAAMAGTGLTALNGQLSVTDGGAVNAIGDADATLTESFNYASATITDNRTWTLPASSNFAVGDTLHVKLANVDPGKKVTIARAGSQTIDGLTAIVLESPNAAVSLKYVAANLFKIF